MALREDTSISIIIPSVEQFNNKTAIRDYLLRQWISENPQTKYRYFVETLNDNSRIYLERPGRLNKGCDFVIYAEDVYLHKNGNNRPPNYDFILEDLIQKKNSLSSNQWDTLLLAVLAIYNCSPYASTIRFTSDLPIAGHQYELLLKLTRWFFIEQDITYWSGAGRNMLYQKILSI